MCNYFFGKFKFLLRIHSNNFGNLFLSKIVKIKNLERLSFASCTIIVIIKVIIKILSNYICISLNFLINNKIPFWVELMVFIPIQASVKVQQIIRYKPPFCWLIECRLVTINVVFSPRVWSKACNQISARLKNPVQFLDF